MKSGDFLEMLMAQLEGGESIEDRLKREAEEAVTKIYVSNFSRLASAVLMAKLLTKEERVFIVDFLHRQTIEGIEKEFPGDLNTIAVCAKTRDMLLETMEAMAAAFDRE